VGAVIRGEEKKGQKRGVSKDWPIGGEHLRQQMSLADAFHVREKVPASIKD